MWISVKDEKKPDENQQILTYKQCASATCDHRWHDRYTFKIITYSCDNQLVFDGISHWMDLPHKPYISPEYPELFVDHAIDYLKQQMSEQMDAYNRCSDYLEKIKEQRKVR